MNGSSPTYTLKRSLLIPATAVTVALTFALPLPFHLLPSSGIPLSARLLPIFYAPLLAALLFPPVVAISASLIAPLINHALTGNPPLPVAAPPAYVAARAVVFFAQQPATLVSGGAWGALLTSLQVALPGLAVLLVLNLVAVSWQGRRSA